MYLLGNKLRSKSTQFMGLPSKVLAIEICSPNCSQFLGLFRRKRGLLPRRQRHEGVRVKLCGAKCMLGSGETLDREPLTLRAP